MTIEDVPVPEPGPGEVLVRVAGAGLCHSDVMISQTAGANSFITNSLISGNPQELDNLSAERSVSANDATHRMVLATIVDLPVGRNRWIGRSCRAANAARARPPGSHP